ncbi:MAG: PA14 domain-containing protein, partial [Isosphaeraceae bacterium]
MWNFNVQATREESPRARRRRELRLEELETRTLRAGGLTATYYDGLNLSAPRLSRVDAAVNFTWGMGAPGSGFNADRFSARWAGAVEVPATGTYTFSTLADDGVRLWVDGRLIIDNWTAHPPTEDFGLISLAAGRKYDLVLEYFESGGWSTCVLSWSSPALAKQVIPSAALSPRTGSGLQATYFTDTNLKAPLLSRVDAAVNFTWGMGAPGSGFNADRFSARWAGAVEVPATGTYTFS